MQGLKTYSYIMASSKMAASSSSGGIKALLLRRWQLPPSSLGIDGLAGKGLWWRRLTSSSSRSFASGGSQSKPPSQIRFVLEPNVAPGKPANEKPLKFYEKMASDRGRGVSMMAMTTAAFGTFLLQLLPHTEQQDKARAFYQHYTRGVRTRPSPKLEALVREAMEDCSLAQGMQTRTFTFVSYAREPKAWGGYAKETGVLLALPYNFNYESVSGDVDLSRFRFGSDLSSDPDSEVSKKSTLKASAYDSPEAAAFAKSLVLTDRARKFAVVREIRKAQTNHFRFQAAFYPLGVLATYVTCRISNKVFRMFSRPPVFRMSQYVLVASLAALASVVARDNYVNWCDAAADAQACSVNRHYAEAGAEFYQNEMNRNLALRKLMPDKQGEKAFNLRGDLYPGLIRIKARSLATRKADCEAAAFKNRDSESK